MTRLLWVPGDEIVLLDSPLSAAELLQAIQRGEWQPPFTAQNQRLTAFCLGNVVIAAPAALSAADPSNPEPPIYLTPRQRQVLQLLADGLTTRAIAARLKLHPRTAALHIQEVKKKLGSASRAQLIGRAAALGLLRLRK